MQEKMPTKWLKVSIWLDDSQNRMKCHRKLNFGWRSINFSDLIVRAVPIVTEAKMSQLGRDCTSLTICSIVSSAGAISSAVVEAVWSVSSLGKRLRIRRNGA